MNLKPIYLELLVKGCSAEMYVNDIALPKVTSPGQPFIARPAHLFLLNGLNKFELLVEPGSTPSTAREGQVPQKKPEARARARLAQYEEGAYVGSDDGEILAQLEWHADPAAVPLPFFPISHTGEFHFKHDLGPWAWQKVDSQVSLERDRAELLALTTRLHHAFEAGVPELILEIIRPCLEDEVKTLPGESVDGLLSRIANDIRGNAGRRDFVRPFEPEQVDFRLLADGRLVDLVYRDWGPILDTLPQPDGEIYPLQIRLGKVGGRFQIIR